ncbi:MAG: T9SS type A sorting domain-containing protein [candidate division WOR-3 bacterium]
MIYLDAMLWLILMFGIEKKGVINQNSSVIETKRSEYIPKVDNSYKLAPFFGYTEEKEQIVNLLRSGKILVDEVFLKKRIERLDSFYSIRWNEEKQAICHRYIIKGIECPSIHPHMNRIYYYYNKWKYENDEWAYAEMITLIEDGERLLGAYIENEKSKINKFVEPAKVSPAIINKEFKKDEFRILDGNNWNTFAIAQSSIYEYNPTIVQVGNEDTLIAGINVSQCNSWCATNSTKECIVVFRSVNAGQSWSPMFCIVPPAPPNDYNVGEVAIGADPYRRLFVVAYTSDYYYPDYDIGQLTFDKNGNVIYNTWVDISTTSTLTPYVNAEFNWGQSNCQGQNPNQCACSSLDNWFFIGMNKGGGGVRIWRSTNCGNSWSMVYNGPARNGSAYNNNQIMIETTNDSRGNSSVCASSNGGDNTIQAVYGWRNSNTDHRIEHLYTDVNGGWGNTWTSTTVLSNYAYPINQPWLSVARRLTNDSTTHFLVFESQFSSTDGDIRYVRANGIPPSGWSNVQNIDYSTVDSRTPTVHTDARWQWCPGATTNTANYFHVAFYHKCPNNFDGSLCNEPYTVYNNSFRVAVLRYNWNLTQRGPEICGNLIADTIAIPPPPNYSNGGIWQNWWQINGTTFRTTSGIGSPWWFGVMWVYRYSSTDWDVEWTILSYNCITPVSKDEVKEGKDIIIKGKLIEIYINSDWEFKVYNLNGMKIFENKGKGNTKFSLSVPKGIYIYKLNNKFGKIII